MQKISIIAAVAKNGVIGNENKLIWHIAEDLKRFKKLTLNHAVIMGRKTYESLPIQPLPNRKNIVITSNPNIKFTGAITVNSPKKAINICKNDNEIFICGGASIYKQFLPTTTNMYLTLVHKNFEGDTLFPKFDNTNWEITDKVDGKDKYEYSFINYKRKEK